MDCQSELHLRHSWQPILFFERTTFENILSGKIPPQLARLTFLEALNLSYNQLEGIIPQSNQFMTFSNDSYRGNPRLCGPPLSRKCNEVVSGKPPPKEDVDSLLDGFSGWRIVLIGLVAGTKLDRWHLGNQSSSLNELDLRVNTALLSGGRNPTPWAKDSDRMKIYQFCLSIHLSKLPALIVLILRGNRFYGPIKVSENNFSALDVLDIASNNFSGQLSIEFFQGTQLRSLKIGGNKLEGRLPRSLANCTKLEVLDLGKNMIHGTFPFWLDKLPSLKVLILRGNGFYGTIKFSKDENSFPMVRILDLAFNNFSSELSVAFFQSLRAMMMMTGENKAKPNYIGDSNYQDSVTIVNKGFEIFYTKILTIFTCLDLSNNNFHGNIPEEIQTLKSLKVLNLSHNSFFGTIPLALGNLTELESLDLSQNKLSGKIPLQLTSLTFLEVLNLSYNQLEGSIPQSYQFGTFSNDSYKGNPKLCGLPLTRKCNEVGPGMPSSKEDVDSLVDGLSDWKIVLIGYGCGLVIGLCIGYTVLNEMGNKWLNSYKRNGKRNRRGSR
ncbi:hypothetical protein REPUB_Repub15cG0086400 [Reevesia pubescens]